MIVLQRLILPLILVVLALPAIAFANGTNKPLQIAFNNPGFENTGFWKDVSDTMKAAANRFNVKLHIWYGDRDPVKIRENASAIFATDIDFDYIIIVNEYQQLSGFLRKAEQRKIPVYFLLNSITDQQREFIGNPGENFKYWLGSIVPDNAKAGYEMATSLQTFAKSAGWKAPYDILSLSGDNRTPASLMRNSGLDRLLEGNDNLTEMQRYHTNWSKDRAYEVTKNYLLDFIVPPRLIWAANDNLGLGAIQAMEERGLTAGQDFGVAALNWSAGGLQAVREKKFTMTHGGHFFAGAWAMVVLHDHAKGHMMEAEIDFPMQAITLANIDEFENKLGDRDWSKIDFTRFSKTENKVLKAYDFSLKNLLAATQAAD